MNMHRFIACALSPLGNECFDFNDATIFPYRLFHSFVSYPSSGGFGRVVANDAFPISVHIKVISTETRYVAAFSIPRCCGVYGDATKSDLLRDVSCMISKGQNGIMTGLKAYPHAAMKISIGGDTEDML